MSFLLHRWWFEIRRRKIADQRGMWINSFLRQLSFALVNMFSVVFVFSFGKEGYFGGGVSGGLIAVLGYFLVVRLTVLVSVIWIGNLVVRRIGYRWSVMVSVVLKSAGLLSLIGANQGSGMVWVWLAGVLMGLGMCGYWSTWLTLIPDGSTEKEMGRSFGVINLMTNLGQALAPLLAAWVILIVGYDWLFGLGVLVLVASGIPMFFLKHHLHLDEVSWREFVSWTRELTYVKAGVAIGGVFVNVLMYEGLWPIYVFLMLGSVEGLGLLRSVVLVATAIFAYLVARLFDKNSSKRIHVLGVAGGIVMWFVRLGAVGLGQIMLVDSIDRLFVSMSSTYFHGYAFRRAKGPETFSFAVYWLVWEAIVAVVVCSLLIGVVLSWGSDWVWVGMAVLGSVGLMAGLLMEEHSRLRLKKVAG